MRYYEEAKEEFQNIVQTYMLPLFDVRGELKFINRSSTNTELIEMKEENGKTYVYFYPCTGKWGGSSPFYCTIGTYSSQAVKKPATRILQELLKVAEYDYTRNFAIKRYYGKGEKRQEAYKNRAMDLAFELGMCQGLTPNTENAITLHTLICRMTEWGSRTYEGKNVPFGIVIKFEESAEEGAADYLHFLENDSSAVFTDGIFSGILLDSKGKVLSFLTRNTQSPKQDDHHDIFVPYQFADMARHCVGTAVGIIVLENGEILIIKKQAVCFVKRGRKWVHFDWARVYSALRPYFLKNSGISEESIKEKIQSVYCTILDVSFAHTGGCLAIIHPDKIEEMNQKGIVVDRLDRYTKGEAPEGMTAESKEKAEILSYLLRYKEQGIKLFFDIEKPLRREILSLDGATVVSLNGSFYCAGCIIAVAGGSSGGGRTAATKQLAEFGVGIKISEDGYVEAYGVPVTDRGELVEESACSIEPLFKFK